ncbi:MAG TPA: FlgD immunoglobulin-like domain containing protein [Candidatus Krumholzibacteria bacterium]|nr:FlgD immunoglobulin-like domain containing protein [Candidatus Krumholzibacteria bacterium]
MAPRPMYRWLLAASIVFMFAAVALAGDFTLYPDHEQVRATLPATDSGVQGGAYCGPTSASDVVNWLNDNGYPGLDFDDSDAAAITLEIFGLGLYLFTDPNGGTEPADFRDGLQDFFDDHDLGDRFEVSYVGRNMGSEIEQTLGHTFGTIGLLLNVGNYVMARVGWYESDGDRCGGHYVAVTGYDEDAGDFTVRFRDPSDGRLQVRTRSIVDGFYDLEDPASGGCPAPCIVNRFASSWEWSRSPSTSCDNTDRNGYQDGIISIRPISLLTLGAGTFLVSNNLATGATHVVTTTTGGPPTTIAYHPHLFHIYHCRPGENVVYKTDYVTNAVTPLPITTALNQPRRLIFGPRLRLYILQGPAAGPSEVLAVEPDFTPSGSLTAPILTDLAYYEAADRIVLWSGPSGQLGQFTPDLTPVGSLITLPSGPTFVNPGYMAVDPRNGIVYYNHNGSSSIFRYNLGTMSAMPALPLTGVDPAGMAVDNRGHLFVARAGAGTVLEFDAAGAPVTGSPATAVSANGLLALTRAVRRPLTNDYTAGRRDNDMPVVLGDFDADLDVDAADMQSFMDCFSGAGLPYIENQGCQLGDFDNDFDVDCDDHTAFRAAWTGSQPPVFWDCAGPTDVLEIPVLRVRLEPVVPNPFNPMAAIAFQLPRPMQVRLTVHDVRGREVRVLASGMHGAGRQRLVWDGTNRHGLRQPSGVYTLRLVTEEGTETRKIVLLE